MDRHLDIILNVCLYGHNVAPSSKDKCRGRLKKNKVIGMTKNIQKQIIYKLLLIKYRIK